MKAYLEYIRISLKLAQRERAVIFFNYVFPLIFFIVFAQAYHAGQGGAIVQVVTMVLILGILGSGFFGAGVRAVQEREANILRRFKVAPITPLPILVASMVTGFLTYMPTVFAVLLIAHFRYGMALTASLGPLLVFAGLGIIAFRSVGLIVASVVNTMQESQILVQLLYLPMLFLSGATFPVSELPDWLQVVAQFLPATYLYTGMQGILFRQESLAANWLPVLGLTITTLTATFIGVKLFRWEREEKVPVSSKLWLVAVLLPFLLIGVYQVRSRDNMAKARVLYRELRRSRTILVRDARIFSGDGTVIERGAVLIRGGRIAELYRSTPPSPESLRAELVEASGKTLLPGLIDAGVRLTQSGGLGAPPPATRDMECELAAYLYSGITAVGSTGDPAALVAKLAAQVRAGERQGAEPVERSQSVYLPLLAAAEARDELNRHSARLLSLSLVEQVGPAKLLAATRSVLAANPAAGDSQELAAAKENLVKAWKSGVVLVAGSGSGAPLLIHGPALHRELQLWVEAGVPPQVALAAATVNAARQLHRESDFGAIAPGRVANLLLVDGNPLEVISSTERISSVFFRGEQVARNELFDQP